MQTRANNRQETTGPLITRCCTMKLDLDLMTLASLCIHSLTSAGGVQLPFLLASNLFGSLLVCASGSFGGGSIYEASSANLESSDTNSNHDKMAVCSAYLGSPGKLKKKYKTEGSVSTAPHLL